MKKDEQQDKFQRLRGELKQPIRRKTGYRQKSGVNKKIISFGQLPIHGKLVEQEQRHDIYEQCEQTPQLQQSQSSFQLDDSINSPHKKIQQKQSIQKVLLKLGLNKKANKKQNQQLEIVVNNIIENCIGTVDAQQNLQVYEGMYGGQFNQKLKAKTFKGSIIISELTDLEKIEKIPNRRIYGVYKSIRLLIKKISLLCQAIVLHPIFESFILLIIILNSIKMAFDDPLSKSQSNSAIQDTFIVLYTIQMTIKIIALGFIMPRNSYLRDPWNIMDFVIVSTSLLPLIVNINFSVNSLRAIRVLRPLKTITKVKSLKMIVSTLFFSFSLVMDSLYILIFVMVVFSIAGTQLFSGLLMNRCMDVITGELTDILCSTGSSCENGLLCAKAIQSPNFSIDNFDTFIWSMLSVFRTLTMQGWSDIMVGLQQAYSPYSLIYSLMIVFFCEYVLLNMTLAILKYKYSQVKGNTIQEEEEQVNEYEPQFLNKIGVYKQVSKLVNQAPLTRYSCNTKSFVGSQYFFKDIEQKKNYASYQLTLSRLQGTKNDIRMNTNLKQATTKIDIQELKNLGKLHEQKWDAKALQFQTGQADENNPNKQNNAKKQQQSDKVLKQAPLQQENIDQFTQSDSSGLDDDDDDDSDSQNSSDQQLSMKSRNNIMEKLYEVQKKLGGQKNNIKIKTSNLLNSHKFLPQLPKENMLLNQNQDVIELDNMLKLIGQSPGSSLTKNKYMINLPEVDFGQMQVQKLYERFDDLGQYRIKRIQKENQLNYFQIKHNKKRNIHEIIKKNQNLIQQIIQEAQLDLKQLQLVNQLSKKQLKCRIKNKQILNQIKNTSSYDITRVIVSQKVKQVEKRQEQIIQNMNSLNFNVTYKNTQTNGSKDLKNQVTESKSILRRNLQSQLTGLKLPELINQKTTKQIKTPSVSTIKSQANNTYLKLLQNHQMQQKIQLQKDRIMQIFFKKQVLSKKQQKGKKNNQNNAQKQQQKLTLIQQYKKIKQDDIFHNHGRINLQLPIEKVSGQAEELLEKINMRQQEYQIYIKGVFGIINVLRKKTLLFVTRPLYDNFMLVLVIANTVILSMNGLVNTDQSPYSDMNTIFTFVFAADLILKVFAFGMDFFGDIMNLFDSFVVCISIVQMSFGSDGGSNLSALRAVRILRAFRVLRITRLIRTLNYMKIVMSVISSIITEFVYIFMLLTLFMFIYTLLGMQIFGGQFLPESVTGVRQSFDNFFNAFFTVFQVLTVQNWNDIQTLVLTSRTGTWSIIYLISWIFIGNWILLNLLQAILLDGFDKDSDIFNKSDDQQQENIKQILQKMQDDEQSETENYSIDQGFQLKRINTNDASLFVFLPQNIIRKISITVCTSKIFQYFIVAMIALSSIKLVVDTYIPVDTELYKILKILDNVFNYIFMFQSLVKIIAQGLILGQKAYLKSSWSKLDFFIVMTAVLDMSLGIDLSILKLFRTLRPLRIISRNPDMKIIISSLGESMLGIFNVLIIIMCIFLMIGILGINLLKDKLNYCNVGGKELNHNVYGPFDVNQTQCQSQGGVWVAQLINFDNIGNSFLSLYVFSTRQNWPFYALTFMDATQTGPVKDNNQLIFLIFSIVIIFVCSYFFMDLLVGVLFMNFHQAQQKIRPKKLSDKQINWKNLQKIIIEQDPCFQLFLKPSNRFSQPFYSIVHKKWFEIFVTLCIVGNIVIMMVATNDQSSEKDGIFSQINFIFSLIFIVEFILKFSAFGKAYFLSGWNTFDFFVVLASILDITLQYTGAKTANSAALSILPQIARIFRVLRVTKLLRMFKRFKGLQKLIQTFIFSLPALAKGLSIVCLFLFIFSVLASFLFSGITGSYSGSFDQYRNFRNFHSSFQTLFIITTGQNWYFYMFETIRQGYITCKGVTQCTQLYYLLFWLVYVFFSQKVFMQLFVLIVLDQFEANYINENNPLGTFSLFQDDFRANWIQMTSKYHSQKIQTKRLLDFLLVLKQPLGLGKNQLMIKYEQQLRENEKIMEQQVKKSLMQLDMKLKKNAAKLLNKISILKNRMYLGYHQTFYHFSKLSIASEFFDSANLQQKQMLEQMHKQSEEALEKLKPKGNLYFYQQQSNENNLEEKQQLNPIQLILFCQMIVKSWHNYSLKYHMEKKDDQNKPNIIQDNSLYDSLNNSCASDIEEAKLQKIDNIRRLIPRKGLLERRDTANIENQLRAMPNVENHYRNDRKKIKTKLNKKKLSTLRNSKRDGSILKRPQGINIGISGQQDGK